MKPLGFAELESQIADLKRSASANTECAIGGVTPGGRVVLVSLLARPVPMGSVGVVITGEEMPQAKVLAQRAKNLMHSLLVPAAVAVMPAFGGDA